MREAAVEDVWIILGASSSMGRAFARRVAAEGHHLVLCARDGADTERTAIDCRLRGAASARTIAFDVRKPESFGPILEAAEATGARLNAAVFVGSMPTQAEIDADPSLVDTTIHDSLTGPARFLTLLAPRMEAQGGGTIVGVGSVAGDRGRLANYTYGAAKAGFHAFLSGLRVRLARKGAHVVTVKPGFTDTAMTWGLEGMFLVASPEKVAEDIWRAHVRRRDVIYTPWFWRIIMGIICAIPERLFKRLSI